jgi:hypothetical protein
MSYSDAKLIGMKSYNVAQRHAEIEPSRGAVRDQTAVEHGTAK